MYFRALTSSSLANGENFVVKAFNRLFGRGVPAINEQVEKTLFSFDEKFGLQNIEIQMVRIIQLIIEQAHCDEFTKIYKQYNSTANNNIFHEVQGTFQGIQPHNQQLMSVFNDFKERYSALLTESAKELRDALQEFFHNDK